MAKISYLVTQEISRYQTVDLEVPDDLLVDGELPDYLLDPDKSQVYEEWVTENVYKEAYRQGEWEENTRETDWEEC